MKAFYSFLVLAIVFASYSCRDLSNKKQLSIADTVTTYQSDSIVDSTVKTVDKISIETETKAIETKPVTKSLPIKTETPIKETATIDSVMVTENAPKIKKSSRRSTNVDTEPKIEETTKANPEKTSSKPQPEISQTNTDNTISKKKQAVLGYSYFSHMQQGESRSIKVEVLSINKNSNVNKLVDSIITTLKESNSQLQPLRKSDTASYLTQTNIFFYKYLTIKLIDPDSNFVINDLGIPSRQQIDTLETNKWQWMVTPKSQVRNTRLVIKVEAEREDGSQIQLDTREIQISIVLSKNWLWTVWNWLMLNPEQLLVLILIPLAVYFGKKIFDRKKANSKDSE